MDGETDTYIHIDGQIDKWKIVTQKNSNKKKDSKYIHIIHRHVEELRESQK